MPDLTVMPANMSSEPASAIGVAFKDEEADSDDGKSSTSPPLGATEAPPNPKESATKGAKNYKSDTEYHMTRKQ